MKKVLFVTYDFPYPTNTGGKNRAYHMLKYSGNDIEKYLFSFIRPDFKKEYEQELEKIGVGIAGLEPRRKVVDIRNLNGLLKNQSIFKSLYFSKKVRDRIISIINEKKIDIVHFESFYTAFFLGDEIAKTGAKQIFGTENIEYILYENFSKKYPWPLKMIFNQQVNKIKNEEIDLFEKADVCVAVSKADAYIINKYKECEIVRNGVDISELKFKLPLAKEGNNLLFVGNFSYFPNVDAINYFYNEVFSKLSLDAKLTIIGKKVNSLKFVNDERIEPIEFIPEISDAYKKADIMVAPIRLGGGTNFKILEAMAAGVPIISLPQRLEGLDVEDGKNIVVANDSEDFIKKLEDLIGDFEKRKKIAKNGRALVEKEYSWKIIGNNLETIWKNL